jgi:hypothetical protein
MNCLSVNCRGCGRPEVVQEIRHVVESVKTAVVFLMETKMHRDRVMNLKQLLGFQNAEVVSSLGQSGGLMLLWRGDVTVAIQSMLRSHIDVLLTYDRLGNRQWRLTGFYGEPRRAMRKNSWYLLRFLRAQLGVPWLCVGDFNEVLEANEHFGINGREQWQMDGFQEVVQDCGFMDLGFSGVPYTWDNRQEGSRNVKVRLDRGLGDQSFLDRFGETWVKHIPLAKSDHCVVLVQVRASERDPRPKGQNTRRVFRYENMWQRHQDYGPFVERTWDPGPEPCNLAMVASSLAGLRSSLSTCDKKFFGSVKARLRTIHVQLEEERNATLYRGPTARERGLMADLSKTLMREEIMERQRSRVEWLKEGDRNTAFFRERLNLGQELIKSKLCDGRMDRSLLIK